MAHASNERVPHAHHFESMDHQFETAKQAMWVFIVQEVLFFAPFFVAYIIFRGMYLETWHAAHTLLNWKMGALNTVILITSSLTMALAVTAAQKGQKKMCSNMLLVTILLGGGFCVVKYFEYAHKVHDGLFPLNGLFQVVQEKGVFTGFKELFSGQIPTGKWATHEFFTEHPRGVLFFSLYFAMTGLHALHVVIGMGIMVWIWLRNQRGEFGPDYFTPVELTGLYWHFVDLVWIYLFPLLYLVS
jgi:cytochrome c oxidase subunit 3